MFGQKKLSKELFQIDEFQLLLATKLSILRCAEFPLTPINDARTALLSCRMSLLDCGNKTVGLEKKKKSLLHKNDPAAVF